jgi:hypothetical protein
MAEQVTDQPVRRVREYKRVKSLNPGKVFKKTEQFGEAAGDVSARAVMCTGAVGAGFVWGFGRGIMQNILPLPEEQPVQAQEEPIRDHERQFRTQVIRESVLEPQPV